MPSTNGIRKHLRNSSDKTESMKPFWKKNINKGTEENDNAEESVAVETAPAETNSEDEITPAEDSKKEPSAEFSIIGVLRLIKKDKLWMSIFVGVFAILGLVAAFTTPKTYTSTVMLAPEESGSGFSGSISSLASMVGMNMKIGQTGDALYPEIYPDLVSSTDFIVKLFPVQISTKDDSIHCDYYTYLTKHNKHALMDLPKAALGKWMKEHMKNDVAKPADADSTVTPLWLSKEEDDVAGSIAKSVSCSVDKKTNVITIDVTDQDPLVAALMADSVRDHLQIAITEYRTKKAKIDLKYMQSLFNEAKKQYDDARKAYAEYADANQDLMLQTYQKEVDELENEMQLKYNIYEEVVQQLQLAKAKVQERTPAFTVIQSATVPAKHSSRSKAATLIMWMFVGFIIRSGILACFYVKKLVNVQD